MKKEKKGAGRKGGLAHSHQLYDYVATGVINLMNHNTHKEQQLQKHGLPMPTPTAGPPSCRAGLLITFSTSTSRQLD